MPISEVYNEDCMIGMARYPDKFFDLAVVDPPYGIKADRFFIRKIATIDKRNGRPIITKPRRTGNWDNARPDSEYFKELRRVSINQIIWGGNYFADLLAPSSCWVVWDKVNGATHQADCELAWTSFKTAVRQIRYMWCIAQGKNLKDGHIAQGNNSLWEKKIHPTHKPIVLYKWLLDKYAQPGNKILDTHMGSQSSRIAAYQMGFDYVGFEIDKEYFEAGNKRFLEQTAQLKLL